MATVSAPARGNGTGSLTGRIAGTQTLAASPWVGERNGSRVQHLVKTTLGLWPWGCSWQRWGARAGAECGGGVSGEGVVDSFSEM